MAGAKEEQLCSWLGNPSPRKKYTLPEVIKRFGYLLNADIGAGGDDLGKLKKEQIKLTNELKQLKLDSEKSCVVNVDELNGQFKKVSDALKNRLEAIERTHGQAVGDDIRAAINECIKQLDIPKPE